MTRAQFFKVLAKYPGVTLDTESEQNADVIQIDSPKGMVFVDNGGHTIVEAFANSGGQSWKPEAYDAVAQRLANGLEPCETEDCDICGEVQ